MVKLQQRSLTIKSVLIFNVLSLIFLFFLGSLNKGISPFSYKSLNHFLTFNIYLILAPLMLSLLLTYMASKLSIVFNILLYCYILVSSALYYLDSFNKVTLLACFIYAVLSYVIFLSLREELEKSYYRPLFSKYEIKAEGIAGVECLLKADGAEFSGKITNLDENSCFCLIESKAYKKLKNIELDVIYEGNKFSCIGHVVSVYSSAYGIEILEDRKKENPHSWSDFYAIISDRGLLKN